MNFSKNTRTIILVFLVALIFFAPGLHIHGFTDRDDEIFYVQATQEMLKDGNILSPTYFGENRFQKPILYYWLILLSYHIFGVGWVAARLVAVIFCAGTVAVTWLIARELFDRKTAWLSSLVLATTPLFFRHARTAVPDGPLTFFIVLAVYAAIRFVRGDGERLWMFVFFISCALGFMIKGYAALIVPSLTLVAYCLLMGQASYLKRINFPLGFLLFAMIVLPWFLYMIKVHGSTYADFMLIHETKDRMTPPGNELLVWRFLCSFGRNVKFYLWTIFQYFAPWSVFIYLAVPWAAIQWIRKNELDDGWRWMLVWFGAVFLFFSCVYVVINHYLLALAVPFSILLSAFLLRMNRFPSWAFRVVKFYFSFLIILSALCLIFIKIFLAGSHVFLGLLILLIWSGLAVWCWRTREPLVPPLITGLLICFIFAQPKLLVEAGMSTHPVLSRLSDTVNAELDDDAIIGVGSHDLHEKEWQIYFDRKVFKGGHSCEAWTRIHFLNMAREEKQVYYLISENDYKKYIDEISSLIQPQIVQEEMIFRRRFRLDGGFVMALLRLDRERVNAYLKEKVFLLKWDRQS